MKRVSVVVALFALSAVAAMSQAGLISNGEPTFKVGSSTGSIQAVIDDANGTSVTPVVINEDLQGNWVEINLEKRWNQEPTGTSTGSITNAGTASMGQVAGSTIPITVFLPSATAAGISVFQIALGQETVVNNTGIVWKDFHVEIYVQIGGSFIVQGAVLAGSRLPSVDQMVVQPPASPSTLRLDFYGGSWPSNNVAEILFTGQSYILQVTLAPNLPTQIVIKEWPTVPEPATMGLLGLGSLAVIARRRRKRVM